MSTDRLRAHHADVHDMSADSIAGRRFAQSWRGYEPEEVKHFLDQVAAQVRSLRERLDAESAARRDAEQRASHPQMDEAALMTAVGDETAGILRTARGAASEITAKAQAAGDALIAEAQVRASQLITEAEGLLASRTAEAETAAGAVRAEAAADAADVRARAQREADELASQAAENYRVTVEAAQSVREKILTDLARRRKLGSVQVEQLRAGRERLLDAYLMVRRTLDDVTDELQRADAEARAAADAVGHHNAASHGHDAAGHGQELVDLRVDEGFDALSVFSEPVTPSQPPAPPVPPVVSGLRPAPPAASSQPSDAAVVPLGPDVAATAVVSGSDAIERVRILPPTTQPEAAAGTGEASVAQEPVAPARDVDDLFARIRAGRAEATASARKALDEVSPAATAPEAGEPEDGPLTAAAVDGAAEDAGQELLRRRDDITAHLESSLARKLKRALQDEQNSLLDRLRSLKVAASPANVMPSADEHPDRFVEAGRPLLEQAASAGSKLVAELSGAGGPVVIEPNVVEDLAEELGRSIAEPLRQRLLLAFRPGDEEPSELADALGAAYREWKTQRIEATARDQVTAAFSRGTYLAANQGTALRWVVSEAEGPCPDCEDNALAGEQAKGEAWPTGQLYPPAHPGCRCALLPSQTSPVLAI